MLNTHDCSVTKEVSQYVCHFPVSANIGHSRGRGHGRGLGRDSGLGRGRGRGRGGALSKEESRFLSGEATNHNMQEVKQVPGAALV